MAHHNPEWNPIPGCACSVRKKLGEGSAAQPKSLDQHPLPSPGSGACPGQRSAFGTRANTWSTCWPHPAQVVFPQVLHLTALHMLFLLGSSTACWFLVLGGCVERLQSPTVTLWEGSMGVVWRLGLPVSTRSSSPGPRAARSVSMPPDRLAESKPA